MRATVCPTPMIAHSMAATCPARYIAGLGARRPNMPKPTARPHSGHAPPRSPRRL